MRLHIDTGYSDSFVLGGLLRLTSAVRDYPTGR